MRWCWPSAPTTPMSCKTSLTALGRTKSWPAADKPGVINPSDLRYPNEPARHKLLGHRRRLGLTGRYIHGHVLAARPGHAANVALAKMLVKAIDDAESLPDFRTDRPALMDINDISAMLPHRYPFLLWIASWTWTIPASLGSKMSP